MIRLNETEAHYEISRCKCLFAIRQRFIQVSFFRFHLISDKVKHIYVLHARKTISHETFHLFELNKVLQIESEIIENHLNYHWTICDTFGTFVLRKSNQYVYNFVMILSVKLDNPVE